MVKAACAIDPLWDTLRELILNAGLVRIVKIGKSIWGVSGGSMAALSGNGNGERESPGADSIASRGHGSEIRFP